ncbi:RNA polymerase sigma factor [Rossellomorea marisflavi]|uniref:RNA polymerase sigma factor n=1 Tax=Rossellomorea marisflavi TaxID=189381 RepID=UPI00345AFC17
MEERFEEVYERYFDDVYQYLLYFTNSRSEAEDLTQETFLRVMKSLPDFRGDSTLKTWILSIARRTSFDHYRKKKILSVLPGVIGYMLSSTDGIPEKEWDDREEWQEVQEALMTLKPDYRNVVILRGLKEYSIKESASILQWNEMKVKVTYHRAIQMLRRKLSRKGDETRYDFPQKHRL